VLEEKGVVSRRRHGGFPGSVTFALSAAGRDLLAVKAALEAWLATAPVGPVDPRSPAAANAVKALSVTPIYSGCKAYGFLSATVDVNGCTYRFIGQASGELANVNVECPAGNEITVTTTGCVMHVEPQTGIAHLKFTNTTINKPDDIDATATLSGIKYTATSGCPGEGTGVTQTNGTLSGGATVKAISAGKQVTLTVDP
jgi:hypothetical protein